MPAPIQPTDILSLQAFLVALAQLDTALPPALQGAIRELGDRIPTDPIGAIAQIPGIVSQHPRLQELYDQTHADLRRRLVTQERSLVNALSTGAPPSGATWSGAVASTLTAGNPVTAARSMVKRFVAERAPARREDDLRALLLPLYRTAHRIDAQERTILATLEYHPSTILDLSFAVGMSVEQVQGIVAALWEGGYVDVTPGQLWHRVFPFLKRSRPNVARVDLETYFSLTMRGHFRLHPLIQRPLRGVVS